MKRSEINAIIRRMEELLTRFQVSLPPFLRWTPQEWKEKGHEYDEIRDNMLGWDITDYGKGRYSETGIALITLRNGNIKLPGYPKPYAEKLIMIEEGQTSPLHYHWHKMEDIINRGGGNLVFRLFDADENDGLSDADVLVHSDGRCFTVGAGSKIVLRPGESLTLSPGCYHEITVEPGTGTVLMGEVSACNDDNADNRFYEPVGRFPAVDEDEPSYRCLCNEYPPAK